MSLFLPNTPYVTSSPSNGLETIEENYIAQNPLDFTYGDVHFYNYESDSWDLKTFPIPRFASEYGYQSMPSVESWNTATETLDDVRPDSDFLANRQHHANGTSENLALINLQLQLPDTSSANYTQAFIYFSQILQAQSIKLQTEHYRSFKARIVDGQGYTMGALYWQLNDVWVAPTWSGIDFTRRWKMLHYFAKDFFSPLIVTGRLGSDNTLEVYVILDALEAPDYDAKLSLNIYQWSSLDALVSIEYPDSLDVKTAVRFTSVDVEAALTTAGCGNDYAEAVKNCFFHLRLLDSENNVIAPFNYVFPTKLKNASIANAKVQINSITATDEEGLEYDILITTDVVALFVWLDAHAIMGRFSENGFLQVEPKKTVHFIADEAVSAGDLESVLTVTHLRDPAYL